MRIYRITDLNGIFLRDDFTHDPETEIALDVTPAQGLYRPKWDGAQWIESATDIPTPTPPEPTESERLQALELLLLDLLMGGAL